MSVIETAHKGQDKNAEFFQYSIFKCIFLKQNCCIRIRIKLKYIPDYRSFQEMIWRETVDKLLAQLMLTFFVTTWRFEITLT